MLNEPIAVDGGLIVGTFTSDGRGQVFKGVPFAAPPVGPLRWRAPQAVVPWQGVRSAQQYGSACIQASIHDDSIMRQFSFDTPAECAQSEDCLYLNVWAPAARPTAGLPVIVWLYGGGHRFGAGSHPVSDGEKLALEGCVVVSLNYRLGALGYLAHPELTAESGTSGNYAAQDILAGLRWVQRHIHSFGGDPGKVTLMGQSAGAAHVSVLMASRQAAGLFQRAVAISSGRFAGGLMGAPMKSLKQAEKIGRDYVEKRGALTLEQMRALPADELLEAERGLWGPIVDGAVLAEAVHTVFAEGHQLKIPLMAGYTSHEASAYPLVELHTRVGFEKFAHDHFGHQAQQMLALYPHADDEQARASSYFVRRDMGFAFQTFQFARLHASLQPQTYLFNFMHVPDLLDAAENGGYHEPEPPQGYGAYHGSELWYFFGNLGKAPFHVHEDDHVLTKSAQTYLRNFADAGDPNGAEMPQWPQFGQGSDNTILLSGEIYSGPAINVDALKFYTRFYQENA